MSDHAGSIIPRSEIRDALQQAILCGDYTFGFRLKIEGLANRFGVSHMPVRKGLFQSEVETLKCPSDAQDDFERTVAVLDQGTVMETKINFDQFSSARAGDKGETEIEDRNLKLLDTFFVFGFAFSRLHGVVSDASSLIRAFAEGAAAIAAAHATKTRNDTIGPLRSQPGTTSR